MGALTTHRDLNRLAGQPLSPPSCEISNAMAEMDRTWTGPPTTWNLPSISDAARKEAEQRHDIITAKLAVPADRKTVSQWLASLGVLVAGRMDAAEAKMRVDAYTDMLEFPLAAYSRESLKRVATAYKWFPSLAEITETLNAVIRELETERFRMGRLAAPPEPKAEPSKPRTEADKERVAEICRQAREAIRRVDAV